MPSTTLTPATALLAPILALNGWTFTMEAWMYATRIPAVLKYKPPLAPSATKEDFNRNMPADVRWKADNYNHLLEQPTQFYAVALALVALGADGVLEKRLAWTYVGLRVLHSLIHVLGNRVLHRFRLFVASSFVLLGLTARAGVLLWRTM
jgi:hypothetical protein